MDSQQFRTLVKDSVESSLSVLGESSRQAIIIHFVKKYSLQSFEDVADHPKEFESFLTALFGYGASILIRSAVAKMFEKINMELDNSEMGFATAVQEVRRMVLPR